ncbi:MAG: GAF domain-containing protein, partial [Nitriliruptor sp.]
MFCLPAIVFAGPGGEPDRPVLAAVAVITLAEVVNRSLAGRVSLAQRTRIGVAVVAATSVLLLVTMARSTLPVPAWLGMVAAASISAAVVRQVTARVGLQALLVVGAGVLLSIDHPDLGSVTGVLSVVGPLVLLVAITVLASALAGDLQRARRRHLLTRRAADRRAELLEAVRQLSRADRGEVVDVTVDALRELGFPAAAVLLVDGGRLTAHRVTGVEGHGSLAGGVSAEALRTGRTVVSPDYRADPRRLPGLDIGAVVASPIQADGRSLGVLTAGLSEATTPPPGDVEVVEVLAAHLGGALVRERVEENQTVLLARLQELDRLRGDFVDR